MVLENFRCEVSRDQALMIMRDLVSESFGLDDRYLPNFIVVGAARCGTTSINYYLKNHPDVFMSPVEESNYFSLLSPAIWGDRGMPLSMYKLMFSGWSGQKCIGEKSPSYLQISGSAALIKQYLPECKIVMTLRHPIDRSISDFNYQSYHTNMDRMAPKRKRQSVIDRYFRFGMANFKKSKHETFHNEHPITNLRKSLYFKSVKEYVDVFGMKQTLILNFDDMVDNPATTRDALCEFLDIDIGLGTIERLNGAEVRLTPSKAVCDGLEKLFRPDIEQLESLIGRQLNW